MNKIIVFDLDNTIGNFDQIIEIMNHTNKKTKEEVHELFDLFPFVFRTNIFDIFHSIARLKKERKIQSVLLYTNNNNDVFIEYILSYIHEKLKYTLFDVIISFNQTKNKNKNMDDLLKFAKLNVDNICFIDDKEYDDMKKCYYIHCEPYAYAYSVSEIYKKVGVYVQPKKNKITTSIYALITKEMLHKIRCFVMI